jgi:hypothetical protein
MADGCVADAANEAESAVETRHFEIDQRADTRDISLITTNRKRVPIILLLLHVCSMELLMRGYSSTGVPLQSAARTPAMPVVRQLPGSRLSMFSSILDEVTADDVNEASESVAIQPILDTCIQETPPVPPDRMQRSTPPAAKQSATLPIPGTTPLSGVKRPRPDNSIERKSSTTMLDTTATEAPCVPSYSALRDSNESMRVIEHTPKGTLPLDVGKMPFTPAQRPSPRPSRPEAPEATGTTTAPVITISPTADLGAIAAADRVRPAKIPARAEVVSATHPTLLLAIGTTIHSSIRPNTERTVSASSSGIQRPASTTEKSKSRASVEIVATEKKPRDPTKYIRNLGDVPAVYMRIDNGGIYFRELATRIKAAWTYGNEQPSSSKAVDMLDLPKFTGSFPPDSMSFAHMENTSIHLVHAPGHDPPLFWLQAVDPAPEIEASSERFISSVRRQPTKDIFPGIVGSTGKCPKVMLHAFVVEPGYAPLKPWVPTDSVYVHPTTGETGSGMPAAGVIVREPVTFLRRWLDELPAETFLYRPNMGLYFHDTPSFVYYWRPTNACWMRGRQGSPQCSMTVDICSLCKFTGSFPPKSTSLGFLEGSSLHLVHAPGNNPTLFWLQSVDKLVLPGPPADALTSFRKMLPQTVFPGVVGESGKLVNDLITIIHPITAAAGRTPLRPWVHLDSVYVTSPGSTNTLREPTLLRLPFTTPGNTTNTVKCSTNNSNACAPTNVDGPVSNSGSEDEPETTKTTPPIRKRQWRIGRDSEEMHAERVHDVDGVETDKEGSVPAGICGLDDVDHAGYLQLIYDLLAVT